MPNKVLLKKSSTVAKVPLVGDIDYGELALNYADGKLYYKTSGNTIDTFPSLSATATLTNKTLTSPTINGGALSGTFSGAHTYSGAVTVSNTTASSSSTTGAVTIGGGLGVAGTIYADQIRLLNNGAGTNVAIGDDAWLGDINTANTIGVRGQQNPTQGYIVFGDANNTNYIGRSGSNPLTVTGQFAVNSGTITGANAIALQISGYAQKGGTGYHDFLSVTNSFGSATNPNKFFRLNSTGALEIINSAYTTNIFSLTDAGAATFGGTTFPTSTGTNGQVLTANGSGSATWTTLSGGSGGTTTNALTIGTGLSGTSFNGSAAVTIAIDSTVTTLTGTQTLTNKTLTAPTITLPTVNNIRTGYSTTVTAAGTTTLTVNSNYLQFFTGTSTQVLSLPAPQTMTLGMGFFVVNNSTGSVEVRAANSATVATVLGGTAVLFVSIDTTAGNGAAGWSAEIVGFSSLTGTGANVLATAPTISSPTVTGTLTAGGSTGTNGYFLQSTGSGVQWAVATSNSVFTANARSDLGYVYDASITFTEDLLGGTAIGVTSISYDLAVLKVDGIVSLDNLDSSVKSDYLAQAIIFGF